MSFKITKAIQRDLLKNKMMNYSNLYLMYVSQMIFIFSTHHRPLFQWLYGECDDFEDHLISPITVSIVFNACLFM